MATSIDRRATGVGAAIFLVATAIFGWTCAPGTVAGDGPEFATAAFTLGIPHPSGYPTYTMIGRLLSATGIAEPARLLNLFAALCGAGAASLLGFWVTRAAGSVTAGIFAGLTACTSLTLWAESTAAEVYSLSALFLALLLVTLPGRRDHRRFLLFCFAAGLSLTNHLSLVFVMPAFVLVALVRARPAPLSVAAGAGLFLAGMTPYFYLLIRAGLDPVWNWGNPSTLTRLIEHVSGKGYWGFFEGNAGGLGVKDWIRGSWRELTAGGIPLAIFGAVVLLRKRTPVAGLLLGAAIPSLFYAFSYRINDPEAYFLFSTLLLIAVAAFGVGRLPRIPALVLALVLPAAQFGVNLEESNRRPDRLLPEYTSNLLLSMEEGAAVIVEGDTETGALVYAQVVEGRRPDLTVWNSAYDIVPDGPLFEGRSSAEKMTVLRERVTEGADVYATFDRDVLGVSRFELRPHGLLFKYVSRDSPAGDGGNSLWPRYEMVSANSELEVRGFLPRVLKATYPVQEARSRMESGEFAAARDLLDRAEERSSGLSPVLNNIGLAYRALGDRPEAMRLFEQAADIARDGLPAMNLASLAVEQGDLAAAAGYYRRAWETGRPYRYGAALGLGDLSIRREDFDVAADWFRRAASERPWEVAPLIGQAKAATSAGRLSDARSWYGEADRLVPGAARRGELAIARFLAGSGSGEEAITLYRTLVRSSPTDKELLTEFALALAAEGEHASSDSVFRELIALAPDDPACRNAFAWSLAEQGRLLDEALHQIKTARVIDPDEASFADTEGWVLYQSGRHADAVTAHREAVRLGIVGSGAAYRLGLALFRAGLEEEGRPLLVKALTDDPRSSHAAEAETLMNAH